MKNIINDVVACPRCKWIGFNLRVIPDAYNVYTGSNPIPEKADAHVCPDCGMPDGFLTIKHLGFLKFLKLYLFEKQEY